MRSFRGVTRTRARRCNAKGGETAEREVRAGTLMGAENAVSIIVGGESE